MNRKLIDDPRLTKELYSTLLHFMLEDESRKLKNLGNTLLVKAEFRDKMNNEFHLEGIVGNEQYICTALRLYETKEGKEAKSELLDDKQLESTKEQTAKKG